MHSEDVYLLITCFYVNKVDTLFMTFHTLCNCVGYLAIDETNPSLLIKVIN